MQVNTFRHLNEELPSSIQNKFIFQSEKENSKIIIRGLGVVDTQNQIDNLINWFGMMSKRVEKLLSKEFKI